MPGLGETGRLFPAWVEGGWLVGFGLGDLRIIRLKGFVSPDSDIVWIGGGGEEEG